jgi:excisionase family DNA binding protein
MTSLSLQSEYAQWKRADAIRAVEQAQWLTMEQVCERIQLPLSTIKLYIKTGKLRAYRPATSRAVRVRASDVDAMFHQIKVGN